MSEKRRWFRFHLLTAVLMTVAAGCCIGANLYSPQFLLYSDGGGEAGGGCTGNSIFVGRGYPLTFFFSRIEPTPDQLAKCELHKIPGERWKRYEGDAVILRGPLAINIFALIGSIAGVAVVTEFLIRRREGRKS